MSDMQKIKFSQAQTFDSPKTHWPTFQERLRADRDELAIPHLSDAVLADAWRKWDGPPENLVEHADTSTPTARQQAAYARNAAVRARLGVLDDDAIKRTNREAVLARQQVAQARNAHRKARADGFVNR